MFNHSIQKRAFEDAIGYSEDESDDFSTQKRHNRHQESIHRSHLPPYPGPPNGVDIPRLSELVRPFDSRNNSSFSQASKSDDICYGMLRDVQIRFNYRRDIYSSALDKLGRSGDDFTILQIEISEDRCDVLTNGIPIATMATKIHVAVTSLSSAAVLRYNGTVHHSELRRKLAEAAKSPQAHDSKISCKIGLTIFGPSSVKYVLAKDLARYRLFLQHPIPMPKGIVYENPQYLSIVASTFSNGAILPPIPTESFQKGPGTMSSSDPDEPTTITAVLDHLPRHEYLSGVKIDKSVRTTLLDHQKEAVNFLVCRESTEKQSGSLWKPETSASGKLLYRHIITGSTSPGPDDMLGGILGDGMGLGKTLSMITCIVSSMAYVGESVDGSIGQDPQAKMSPSPVGSTLVIVPSVLLLDEWLKEIEKHIVPGTLSVYKYHGPSRKLPSSPPLPYHIVLSTYGTVAADHRRGGGVLACFHWRRLILDEAHVIRNWSTKQFKAMKDLSASIRWCITGTPVQNSLRDLASLITFLRVPLLDDAAMFRKHIEGRNTTSNDTSKTNFRNLRHLLESICLRRCTTSILSSLGVSFTEHRPHLSEDERHNYDKLSILCDQYIKAAVNGDPTEAGNKSILTAVLRMRMFCNIGLPSSIENLFNAIGDGDQLMPDEAISLLQQCGEAICANCKTEISSLDADVRFGKQGGSVHHRLKCEECAQPKSDIRITTESPESLEKSQTIIMGDMMEDIEFEHNHTSASIDNGLHKTSYPSKILALVRDITAHSDRGKSIVFSFWRRSLGLVEKAFMERGIIFGRVDGTIHPSRRREVLVAFQEDPSIRVLLMTIGTGAVGLNNLSVENRVHILEPQWNPAIEDQAIGRVARLGQTQKVTVVRYVVKNTIEEVTYTPLAILTLRNF
ncbi:SNF2 family N-terminal domain-containing protein [Nemania abortiva]|nr:SNF2 family N-terminal domain-containing protein [Nemania abortiva]